MGQQKPKENSCTEESLVFSGTHSKFPQYEKNQNLYLFILQHPVYCMKVVGTQNAHNLISISTDGKMCSWSLDMLSQPQESMELQHKQSRAVAVTCLGFPHNDVNNFIVGSEEGTVCTGKD